MFSAVQTMTHHQKRSTATPPRGDDERPRGYHPTRQRRRRGTIEDLLRGTPLETNQGPQRCIPLGYDDAYNRGMYSQDIKISSGRSSFSPYDEPSFMTGRTHSIPDMMLDDSDYYNDMDCSARSAPTLGTCYEYDHQYKSMNHQHEGYPIHHQMPSEDYTDAVNLFLLVLLAIVIGWMTTGFPSSLPSLPEYLVVRLPFRYVFVISLS